MTQTVQVECALLPSFGAFIWIVTPFVWQFRIWKLSCFSPSPVIDSELCWRVCNLFSKRTLKPAACAASRVRVRRPYPWQDSSRAWPAGVAWKDKQQLTYEDSTFFSNWKLTVFTSCIESKRRREVWNTSSSLYCHNCRFTGYMKNHMPFLSFFGI